MIPESTDLNRSRVIAIVPAAGTGSRMGGPVPKQYREIGGETVLGLTLKALARSPSVEALIVAASKEELGRAASIASTASIPFLVVEGGAERFDSVRYGLDAALAGVEIVVVHDGVRPFVSEREIEEVVAAARSAGAAIVATPPVETVKRTDRGIVVETLDRETILLAQTPQAFQADLFRRAYQSALDDGFVGTDEAALVERIGAKVSVVEGNPRNRKITTEEDLARAEWSVSRKAGG